MVLDADDDRIAYSSPLAQLLLGLSKCDTIIGTIGARNVEFQIADVGISEEEAPATTTNEDTADYADRYESRR